MELTSTALRVLMLFTPTDSHYRTFWMEPEPNDAGPYMMLAVTPSTRRSAPPCSNATIMSVRSLLLLCLVT